MGNLYETIKLQQIENESKIEKINKEIEKEMYKNCKCNECVWAYKDAYYCPLGKCINEGEKR